LRGAPAPGHTPDAEKAALARLEFVATGLGVPAVNSRQHARTLLAMLAQPAMPRPSANLESDRHEFACAALSALAPSLPSRIVFDIGSAGMEKMRRIEQLGFDWHGFDLHPAANSARWDLAEPCPSDLRPGAALLLDTIEHCENPGLAFRNIAAIMPRGAALIVTVPNPGWSRARTDLLLRGSLTNFDVGSLEGIGHVFTPWPHIIEKMLTDIGFVIDNYVTLDGKTNIFKRPFSVTYPARCLLALVQVVIEKLDPSACGASYGLIARKVGV
jgi:hypothetical protein